MYYATNNSNLTLAANLLPNSNLYAFTTSGGLTTTTSFKMTMSNGVCPVLTTPSLLVQINTQPEIRQFYYPSDGFCTNLTTASPLVSFTGSVFQKNYSTQNVLPTSINELNINNNTGVINPSLSYGRSGGRKQDQFTVYLNIPAVGACNAISTTTSLSIGQEIRNPSFTYGTDAFCSSKGLISPVNNSVENSFVNIGYYTTTVAGIASANFTNTGILNISSLTATGLGIIYPVKYKVDAYAGCPSISLTENLTVTGLPSQPSFNYNKLYCSNIGVVTVNSPINIQDPFGYWKMDTFDDFGFQVNASDYGVFINSITGTFTTTGNSQTNQYLVTYTKPARGGCTSDVVAYKFFSITQLDQAANFVYSPNELCSNSLNKVGAPSITIPGTNRNVGRYISPYTDIIADATTGELTLSTNKIAGLRAIQYVISATGSCAGNVIVSTAQINFKPLPEPSFSYSTAISCKQGKTYSLIPKNLIDIDTLNPQGYFYEENGKSIKINSITGVITVNSLTSEAFYNIQYILPPFTLCGANGNIKGNKEKSYSLYIENAPTKPDFNYGNEVICSRYPRQAIINVGNQKNINFYAISDIPINSLDGTIYIDKVAQGMYVITCTNASYPININGVQTTTCPVAVGYATITVASGVYIPQFNYGRTLFCNDQGIISLVGVDFPTGGYYNASFSNQWLNSITGTIDLSRITLPSSGSEDLTISYTVNRNNCTPVISSVGINVTKAIANPTINYSKSEYCINELNQSPLSSSIFSGGVFQGSSGLVIDSLTGVININHSQVGSSQIKYIVPNRGGCQSVSSQTSIFIRPFSPAELSYGSEGLCQSTEKVNFKIAYPSGGVFLSSYGLSIDGLGNIYPKVSKAGISIVNYSVAGVGECPAVMASTVLTISSPFVVQSFDFDTTTYCNVGTLDPILSPNIGFNYFIGSFSSDSGLVFIDKTKGKINLKKSSPFIDDTKYNVYYTVNSKNGCDGYQVIKKIGIRTGKAGKLSSDAEKGIYCESNSNITISLQDVNLGNLIWQQRSNSDLNWSSAQGTITGNKLLFNSQKLNDTTYFRVRAIYNGCNDSVYSNPVKVRVIPNSKGGTATGADGVLDSIQICNEYRTELVLRDYIGKIVWQYYEEQNGIRPNGTSNWTTTDEKTDTSAIFFTKSQNQYGNRRWFRAKVTNGICDADYSSRVLIQVCDNKTFVPNAFTPNSANDNSYWDLTKLNLREDAIVRVYNRYGTTVYSSTGKDVQTASGCWDGSGLPMGAYYYIIDKRDQTKPLTGSISIVR